MLVKRERRCVVADDSVASLTQLIASRVVLLALLLYFGAAQALANTSNTHDRTLAQLHHTAWSARDGAPPDIWALAQGPDGYLWLGTGTGLYRFDGMRFERFQLSGQQLLSNNITAVSALPSGELWIGYYFGGLTRLKDGRYTHYTSDEGAPSGTVFRFAVDHDGTVWVATSGGLGRFSDDRWSIVGADWNFPAQRADWVHVDRGGALWVTTRETLVYLPRGARSFEATGERVGLSVLAEAPNGRMWIADELRGTRSLPDFKQGARALPRIEVPLLGTLHSKRMLFDRAGNLWGTDALRGGLYRVRSPLQPEHPQSLTPDLVNEVFTKADGLTSDVAVPLLEDDEGNIWVGTNLGLNRFRRGNFVVERRIDATSPYGFVLAPAEDGAMYVVNSGSLLKVGPSTFEVIAKSLPQIDSAYRTPQGVLWLGGADGLRRLDGRGLIHTRMPDYLSGADVQAITADREGVLWIALHGAALHQFDGERWLRVSHAELPRSTPSAQFTDSRGRLWFGYPESALAMLDSDRVRTFTGLELGPIMSINAGRHYVWAGGDLGIAQFDGERVRTLNAARVPALSGVSGVIEADGALWLNGLLGVVRVEVAEIERALADPDHELRYELFDSRDGLPGVAQQAAPVPTLAADSEGRLWFATNHGVVWLDPVRLLKNARPPSVVIRSIAAGDRIFAAGQDIVFPKRTSDVRIDYTALSLSIPERIRFSYKLDGAEGQWRNAGARREAFYTNLGPGEYRFQLRASNSDGIWSAQPATLAFVIEPAFVETHWFAALCVIAMFILAWLAYRLHMRQMAARLRARLEERLIERERIARELHDTLLQGVQALILRFQAAMVRIPPGEAARDLMEQALDRADQVLIEGRDRVQDLRTSPRDAPDLAQALLLIGEELAQNRETLFRIDVEGAPRVLHPISLDEACRIGEQAISNAFQHANAPHIEVTIVYGRKELRLRVRDDGCGIDPEVLAGDGRPGHWGFPGMRERAQKLRAHFDIRSRPGAGTDIELRIPASIAYVAHRPKTGATAPLTNR